MNEILSYTLTKRGKENSKQIDTVEKLTASDVAFERKINKLHKSLETTIATALNLSISSTATFDTESASIASNVISLSNSNDDQFVGIVETLMTKDKTEQT